MPHLRAFIKEGSPFWFPPMMPYRGEFLFISHKEEGGLSFLKKHLVMCALKVSVVVFRLRSRLTSNTSQTTLTHACPCFDGCCKSAAAAPLATGLRNERPWGTYVLSCIMQSDVNKTEL